MALGSALRARKRRFRNMGCLELVGSSGSKRAE
jgi:hypothetical protein